MESWSWKLFDPIDLTRVKRQAAQICKIVTYVPQLYKLTERTQFVRILGESSIFEKMVKSFWNFLTFSKLMPEQLRTLWSVYLSKKSEGSTQSKEVYLSIEFSLLTIFLLHKTSGHVWLPMDILQNIRKSRGVWFCHNLMWLTVFLCSQILPKHANF